MIRAYQNIRRRFSLNKHQKLLEDSQCQDPVNDGVTFYVRYLGCCGVPRPSGEEVTAEAIKTIIQAARKDNRRLIRVSMLISVRGIKMSDLETGKTLLNFSIYRISYCSADATFTHVFAFIAVNRAECLQCHAFLARKQKIAQTATLTIAQAFNLAFDKWKQAQSRRDEEREEKNESSNQSVATTESTLNGHDGGADKRKCRLTGTTQSDPLEEMNDEVLLIDLRSPDRSMQIIFEDLTETSSGSNQIRSTSIISPAPSPILSLSPPPNIPQPHLQPQSLGSSPLASPMPSPLHGSCLTPRKLMTPSNSPLLTVRSAHNRLQPRPSPLATTATISPANGHPL